ncbi:putative acetyltransferase [compost metagenome]
MKLDNLFVLPEYIGKGLGKILMRHFLLEMNKTSVNKIILNSEPNAELFYAKLGFVKTGQIETSIKDRFMPIMELNIKSE